MYPRSFLCEEAEIKQRTPLKKEFCEIDEEAIWESRFTSFFILICQILRKFHNHSCIIKNVFRAEIHSQVFIIVSYN